MPQVSETKLPIFILHCTEPCSPVQDEETYNPRRMMVDGTKKKREKGSLALFLKGDFWKLLYTSFFSSIVRTVSDKWTAISNAWLLQRLENKLFWAAVCPAKNHCILEERKDESEGNHYHRPTLLSLNIYVDCFSHI